MRSYEWTWIKLPHLEIFIFPDLQANGSQIYLQI